MGHIFISYSHKDKDYAHKLQEALQKEGFDVWIDDRINYGTEWPKVIQKHLDECEAFIVVVSENAYKSKWVQNEVTRADRKGKPIFPVLLEGDPWLSVETLQYVPASNGSLPPKDFYESLSNYVLRNRPNLNLLAQSSGNDINVVPDPVATIQDIQKKEPPKIIINSKIIRFTGTLLLMLVAFWGISSLIRNSFQGPLQSPTSLTTITLKPILNTTTPSATKIITSTPGITPSITATIAITPALPVPTHRPYESSFVFDSNLVLPDNKPCWQSETELNLNYLEGFFRRNTDKYWGFGITENEMTIPEERPVAIPVYVDFSQCIKDQQIMGMGLNAWIIKLVPERDNPVFAPGIIDPGREFGVFIENQNGIRREYTIWIDKDKALHLNVRENGSVVYDNNELVISSIQTDGAYPHTYNKFSIQIFLEINNNGVDTLSLLQGSGKAVEAESLDPIRMILKSSLPTLGNFQKIGLVGYGGETKTILLPLAFFESCTTPEVLDFAVTQKYGIVSLSWKPTASTTTYQVFKSSNNKDFSPLSDPIKGYTTSTLVDNIPINSSYSYRIVATNICGDNKASDTILITRNSESPLGYGKPTIYIFPLEKPNGKRMKPILTPNTTITILEAKDEPGGPWYLCTWNEKGTQYEGWVPASSIRIVPPPTSTPLVTKSPS